MAEPAVRLPELRAWSVRLLVKQGMFAAEAEIAAERLIQAELLGRTAGGLRWLPRLIAAMDVGDIDPRAQLVTLTDLPALAVIDGSTGVGQVALDHALHLAVTKARDVGSATVVIKNSRPVGDPAVCLAPATSAGCVAGIMTTCKQQSEPWPVGSCSLWGWPTASSPLATSSFVPFPQPDRFAEVLPAALGGTKPALRKKRLFADDAEHVCFVIDPRHCTEQSRFQEVAGQALGDDVLAAPDWLFDPARWPDAVEFPAAVVAELRELAASSRVAAEW